MALRAEVLEDGPPRLRIAAVPPEVLSHLGDDLLPLRTPLRADGAPLLLDRPDRLAVVALQDLAEVIVVQGGPGALLFQYAVEQLASPRLPLQQEIDRQRLTLWR